MLKNIIFIVFCFTSSIVYAEADCGDDFVLTGVVYGRNRVNQEIPQYFLNFKNQLIVEIKDMEKTIASPPLESGGKFVATITKGNYEAGKKISLHINKPGWYVASPSDGVMYLPKSCSDDVKVVLEEERSNRSELSFRDNSPKNESYSYTVQAISTRDETAAIHLKNKLKEENSFVTYIEKYMVSNMPNNGYEYKVKIGDFDNKLAADNLKDKLSRKYERQYGFFVTLKGHK